MNQRLPFDDRSERFPALTICQPWAWAIVDGPKRFENRSWPIKYRGPLWIHAGKSQAWMQEGTEFLFSLGLLVPTDLPFGALVGLVDVVDCLPVEEAVDEFGDRDAFAFGPWCHQYANVRRLREPIWCSGAQGLWVPKEMVNAEW